MDPVRLRGPVVSPLAADRAAILDDGIVTIDRGGRIAAVEPWDETRRDGPPVVPTGRALILPAFVDAHVHLPQIDVRGRYGEGLLAWLDHHVYPAEASFADPAHAERTARRFFSSLAASGIGTAAVFATVHAEAAHRALGVAAESGLRVVLGKVLMDRGAPDALLEAAGEGIRASLELAERWEGGAGGRLATAITPRFALSCSPDLLSAAGRAAREAGLRVQTHLAEQPDEVEAVSEAFPDAADYLDVYERADLVGERTILAHAIHCSDGAYRRIAAHGAAIACCPTSNAFLRSGRFPLARARAAGVEIAAGSDVGAGPQFSPLDVLRHLAYLDRLTPDELLYQATWAGARALGSDGISGRLEAGLAADLVVLEPPPDATGTPLERFAQCVFRQPETRVVATLVEGRVVHGRLPDDGERFRTGSGARSGGGG